MHGWLDAGVWARAWLSKMMRLSMDHWLKPLAFSKDARARALVPAAARSKLQPRHSGSYTGRTKASSSNLARSSAVNVRLPDTDACTRFVKAPTSR